MTVQQLEYFMSCATLLSFRKAADIHYTSPSTVTRQIAALEQELGIQLLDRTTHGVSVTEEGKLFFFNAQAIVNQLSDFREGLINMGSLPPDEEPVFRICAYPCDGTYRIMVDRLRQYPGGYLSKPAKFIFPRAGGMVSAVKDGAAQIGVDLSAQLTGLGDEFHTRIMHRSPYRLVV